MSIFTDLAVKATTLSPIMENRDKISVREIISQYPNGITINGIDMVTSKDTYGNDATYPVFTFKEDPTKFGFGGAIFKSIVESWIAAFNGSIDDVNTNLKLVDGGGCKCRFSHGKTKNGRDCTIVEPVVS